MPNFPNKRSLIFAIINLIEPPHPMISKPTIILVDDHLPFRQGLKSIIEARVGHIIGEASNGIELIGLLSHSQPDLVIMDIDMPLMDGIEATQKALELFPDLKIIIYTMFDERIYLQPMTDLGAKALIRKSIGIDQLETVILGVFAGYNYLTDSLPEINPHAPDAESGLKSPFQFLETGFHGLQQPN